VAGDGGCVLWPAAAGILRAKRYLLTGDRLPAEEAFALGLVTDLVDTADETLPAARALAARMAALPPLAVQGTKRALNRLLQQRAGEVLDLSITLEAQSMASDDLAEAISAFKARRPPKYLGR
jgi:enoyl-CoA hydratase